MRQTTGTLLSEDGMEWILQRRQHSKNCSRLIGFFGSCRFFAEKPTPSRRAMTHGSPSGSVPLALPHLWAAVSRGLHSLVSSSCMLGHTQILALHSSCPARHWSSIRLAGGTQPGRDRLGQLVNMEAVVLSLTAWCACSCLFCRTYTTSKQPSSKYHGRHGT